MSAVTMKWTLEKRVAPMRAQVALPNPANGEQVERTGAPLAQGVERTAQLVRLIEDLVRRLKNSETERQLLWREIEEMRQTLNDIDHKSNAGETAYVQIENKIAHRDRLTEEVMDRQKVLENEQRALLDSLSSSLAERETLERRLADIDLKSMALSDQIVTVSDIGERIERKFEKLSDQGCNLSVRMAEIEQSVQALRDGLNAKALVVLTDAALAGPGGLRALGQQGRVRQPHTPSYKEHDTTAPLPGMAPLSYGDEGGRASQAAGPTKTLSSAMGWLRGQTARSVLMAALLMGLGAGLGLMMTADNTPSPSRLEQTVTTTGVSDLSSPAAGDDQAPASDDPGSSSSSLNGDVSPATGAAVATVGTTDDALAEAALDPDKRIQDARTNARLIDEKVTGDLLAEAPSGPLTTRLEKDTSLPAPLKKIEKAAFDGNAEAQHDLGAIYIAGHGGVPQDYSRALNWFTESAYGGVANARYNLGVMHHQGLGIDPDPDRAIQWYRAAAILNHPEALYNLGIASIEGIGLSYDPYLATSYFLDSARAGVVEAAYNLGLIYQNGVLGKADPEQGYFWLSMAAQGQSEEAGKAADHLIKDQKWTPDQAADILQLYRNRFPDIVQALGAKQDKTPVS